MHVLLECGNVIRQDIVKARTQDWMFDVYLTKSAQENQFSKSLLMALEMMDHTMSQS